MTFRQLLSTAALLTFSTQIAADLVPLEEGEMTATHATAGVTLDLETDFSSINIQHQDSSVFEISDSSLDLTVSNFRSHLSGIDIDISQVDTTTTALSIGLPDRLFFDQTNIVFSANTPSPGSVINTGPPTPVQYQLDFGVSNNPFDVTFFGNSDFNENYSFSLQLSSSQVDSSLYTITRTSGPSDTDSSQQVYSWTVDPNNGSGGPDEGSALLTISKGGFYTISVSVEGCNVRRPFNFGADSCEPSLLEIDFNGNTLSAGGGHEDNEVVTTEFSLGFLGPRDEEWITYTTTNLEILDVTLNGTMYSGGQILVFGL